MAQSTGRTRSALAAACVALAVRMATAYRMVSLDEGVPITMPAFRPYTQGGAADAQVTSDIPQAFLANAGNAFSEGTQPNVYRGVLPRIDCPGMVGPFNHSNSGLYVFYCSAKHAGYCDRRSGTCFCNPGYMGDDCGECEITHRRAEGNTCEPRAACPNDCSGGGECDAATGTCKCDKGRRGIDCSLQLCRMFDRWCRSCSDDGCRQCEQGYYLDTWYSAELQQNFTFCQTCTVHDPNCLACDGSRCLVCSDYGLRSVSRSGRRAIDPDVPLHLGQYAEIPFGSQDPEAAIVADSYLMVDDYQLQADRGMTDARWTLGEACASLLNVQVDDSVHPLPSGSYPSRITIAAVSPLDAYRKTVKRLAVNCGFKLGRVQQFTIGNLSITGPTVKLLDDAEEIFSARTGVEPIFQESSLLLALSIVLPVLAADKELTDLPNTVELQLASMGLRAALRRSSYDTPSRGAVPGSPLSPTTLYAPALFWESAAESNDGKAGQPLNAKLFGNIYTAAMNSSTNYIRYHNLVRPTNFAQDYADKGGIIGNATTHVDRASTITTLLTPEASLKTLTPAFMTNVKTAASQCAPAGVNCTILHSLLTYADGEVRHALEILLRHTRVADYSLPDCPKGVCWPVNASPAANSTEVRVYVNAAEDARARRAMLLNASAFACSQGDDLLTQYSSGFTDALVTNESLSILSYSSPVGLMQHALDNCHPSYATPRNSLSLSSLSEVQTWQCNREEIQHVYCGHTGAVGFSSDFYVVYENAQYLQVDVTRSGGGLGAASVTLSLFHISTDDSDVSLISPATLDFDAGVVRLRVLIAIHDDYEPEGEDALLPRYTELHQNGTMSTVCHFPACADSRVNLTLKGCAAEVTYQAPAYNADTDAFLRINTKSSDSRSQIRDAIGPSETFELRLSAPCCGMQLGKTATTTVAILDDDSDRVGTHSIAESPFTYELPSDIRLITAANSFTSNVQPNITAATNALQGLVTKQSATIAVDAGHDLAVQVATLPCAIAGTASTVTVLPRDIRGSDVYGSRLTRMFTATAAAPGNGSILSHVAGSEAFVMKLTPLAPKAVLGSPFTFSYGTGDLTSNSISCVAASRKNLASTSRKVNANDALGAMPNLPVLSLSSFNATSLRNSLPMQSLLFTATYNFSTRHYAATAQVNTAGIYETHVYRAVPGGLTAEYFNGTEIYGECRVRRVDPQVLFHWGYQPILRQGNIPSSPTSGQILKDVAVSWRGTIAPPKNGSAMRLHLLTTQPVRVWLDEVLLLDTWDIPSAFVREETSAGGGPGWNNNFVDTIGAEKARQPGQVPAPPGINPSSIHLPINAANRTARTICTYGGLGHRMPKLSRTHGVVQDIANAALLDEHHVRYLSDGILCIDALAQFPNGTVALDELRYFSSPLDVVLGASEPNIIEETVRAMNLIASTAQAFMDSGVLSSEARLAHAVPLPVILQPSAHHAIRIDFRRLTGFAALELLWSPATNRSAETLQPVPSECLYQLQSIRQSRFPGDGNGHLANTDNPLLTYVHPAEADVTHVIADTAGLAIPLSPNATVNATAVRVTGNPELCSPDACAARCMLTLRYLGLYDHVYRTKNCDSSGADRDGVAQASSVGTFAVGGMLNQGIPGVEHVAHVVPRDRFGNFRGILGALDVINAVPLSLLLHPAVTIVVNSSKVECTAGSSVGFGNQTRFALRFSPRTHISGRQDESDINEYVVRDSSGQPRLSSKIRASFNITTSTASLSWRPTKTGIYALAISLRTPAQTTARHIHGSPFLSHIMQAEVGAATARMTLVSGNGVHSAGHGVVAGNAYIILLQPRDRYGNPILTWTTEQLRPSDHRNSFRADAHHIRNSSIRHLIEFSPFHVPLMETGNHSGTYGGRLVTHYNDWYAEELSSLEPATRQEVSRRLKGLSAEMQLGTYYPTQSGGYVVRVMLGSDDVPGSPFIVTVAPGPTSGPHCTLSFIDRWTTQEDAVAVLTLRDRFGNVRTETAGAEINPPDDDVSIRVRTVVESAWGNVSWAASGASRYLGNGTYSLSMPCMGLECEVEVRVKSTHVAGSPFRFTRLAGPPAANQSYVWGPGALLGVAGRKSWSILQTHDVQGNPRKDPAAELNPPVGALEEDSLLTKYNRTGIAGVGTVASRVEAWLIQISQLASDGLELLSEPATNCSSYAPAATSYAFTTHSGMLSTLPKGLSWEPSTVDLTFRTNAHTVPRWAQATSGFLGEAELPRPLLNDTTVFAHGNYPQRWKMGPQQSCLTADPCAAVQALQLDDIGGPTLPAVRGDGFQPYDLGVGPDAQLFVDSLASSNMLRLEMMQEAARLGLKAYNVSLHAVPSGNGAILMEYTPEGSGVYLMFVTINQQPVIGTPLAVGVAPGRFHPQTSDVLATSTLLRSSAPLDGSIASTTTYNTSKNVVPISSLGGLTSTITEETIVTTSSVVGAASTATALRGFWDAYADRFGLDEALAKMYPRAVKTFDARKSRMVIDAVAGSVIMVDTILRDAFSNRITRRAAESTQLRASWLTPKNISVPLSLFPSCYSPGTHSGLFIPTTAGRHRIMVDSMPWTGYVATKYYNAEQGSLRKLITSRLEHTLDITVSAASSSDNRTEAFASNGACSVKKEGFIRCLLEPNHSRLSAVVDDFVRPIVVHAENDTALPGACTGAAEMVTFILTVYNYVPYPSDQPFSSLGSVRFKLREGSTRFEESKAVIAAVDTSNATTGFNTVWPVHVLMRAGCFYQYSLEYTDPIDIGAAFRKPDGEVLRSGVDKAMPPVLERGVKVQVISRSLQLEGSNISTPRNPITVPQTLLFPDAPEAVGMMDVMIDISAGIPDPARTLAIDSTNVMGQRLAMHYPGLVANQVRAVYPYDMGMVLSLTLVDRFGNQAIDYYTASAMSSTIDNVTSTWQSLQQCGVTVAGIRGFDEGGFKGNLPLLSESDTECTQGPTNGQFTTVTRFPTTGLFETSVSLLPTMPLIDSIQLAKHWVEAAKTESNVWRNITSISQFAWGAASWHENLARCKCEIPIPSNISGGSVLVLPSYFFDAEKHPDVAAYDIDTLLSNSVRREDVLPCTHCHTGNIQSSYYSKAMVSNVAGEVGVVILHVADAAAPPLVRLPSEDVINAIIRNTTAPIKAFPCALSKGSDGNLCSLVVEACVKTGPHLGCSPVLANIAALPQQVRLPATLADTMGSQIIALFFNSSRAGVMQMQVKVASAANSSISRNAAWPLRVDILPAVASPSESTIHHDSGQSLQQPVAILRLAEWYNARGARVSQSGITIHPVLTAFASTMSVASKKQAFQSDCAAGTEGVGMCSLWAGALHPAIISRLAYWSVLPTDAEGFELSSSSATAADMRLTQHILAELAASGPGQHNLTNRQSVQLYLQQLDYRCATCEVDAQCQTKSSHLDPRNHTVWNRQIETATRLMLRDSFKNARLSSGGSTPYHVLSAAHALPHLRPFTRTVSATIGFARLDAMAGWQGIPGAGTSLLDRGCTVTWAASSNAGTETKFAHTGATGDWNLLSSAAIRIWAVDDRNGSFALQLPQLSLLFQNRTSMDSEESCGHDSFSNGAMLSANTLTLVVSGGLDTQVAIAADAREQPLVNVTRWDQSFVDSFAAIEVHQACRQSEDHTTSAGECTVVQSTQEEAVRTTKVKVQRIYAKSRLWLPTFMHSLMPTSGVGDGLVLRLLSTWEEVYQRPLSATPSVVVTVSRVEFHQLWRWKPPQVEDGVMSVNRRAAVLSGYILAPIDALYTFQLDCDGPCEMAIDGMPLLSYAPHMSGGDGGTPTNINLTANVALRGPQLYRIMITALRLEGSLVQADGVLRLFWRWDAGPLVPKADTQKAHSSTTCSWVRQNGEASDCTFERQFLRHSALQYRSQPTLAAVPKEALFSDEMMEPMQQNSYPVLLQLPIQP